MGVYRDGYLRVGGFWFVIAALLVSAPAAKATVISSAVVETSLMFNGAFTSTGVLFDDTQYQIRGGVSVFDQGEYQTPGGETMSGFGRAVKGTDVGDALTLNFADGFVTDRVFDMGLGDDLYLYSFAMTQADGPSGLADAFMFGNGALEIANFSSTEDLYVDLTWSIYEIAYALASVPMLEDGYATADLTFEAASIAAGTNILSDRFAVIDPQSLTADSIFGPPNDMFSAVFDFLVVLSPGESQFLFLTADAASTSASLEGADMALAPVPLPASMLFLLSALIAVARLRWFTQALVALQRTLAVSSTKHA